MSKTNFDKVLTFNKVFEVPVSEKPRYNIFDDDPKLVDLRVSLIGEEINELIDAVKDKNFTEILDALLDIQFVTHGMGTSFGLNLDRGFTVVHVRSYKEKGVRYNIFEEVPDLIKMKLEIIKEEFKELKIAVDSREFIKIHNTLVDIIVDTYGMGASFGFDMDKAFDIVFRSNMSKSCISPEEAQKTVEWYKNKFNNGQLPYDTPSYKKSSVGNYWIVFNESTGKILKSINYSPVDFTDIFNKAL